MNDDDLKAALGEFEAAAKAVQEGLLARNTGRIWAALAQQELAAERLGAIRRDHAESVAGSARRDSAIRHLADRCRTMLLTNRALAGRFLAVIDQTLLQLGGGVASTYPVRGAAPRRSSPLLVRQQG